VNPFEFMSGLTPDVSEAINDASDEGSRLSTSFEGDSERVERRFQRFVQKGPFWEPTQATRYGPARTSTAAV